MSAAYSVNQLPVVLVGTSGPGTFTTSPLAGVTVASGYTVMAVWRVPSSSQGGHPLGCSATAKFAPSGWSEAIETSSLDRTMPTPNYVTPGEVVAAEWTRSGSGAAVRLQGGGAPREWAGTVSPVTTWTASPAVGRGGALHLAELLVWTSTLTVAQAAAVKGYLTARWGVAPPVVGVVSVPSALPSLANSPLFVWSAENVSTMLSASGTPVATSGSVVRSWLAQTGTVDASSTWLSAPQGTGEVTYVVDSGGRRGIRFPGSGSNSACLEMPGAGTNIRGRLVFVVLRYVGNSDGSYPVSLGNSIFHFTFTNVINGFMIRPNITQQVCQNTVLMDTAYVLCFQLGATGTVKIGMTTNDLVTIPNCFNDNLTDRLLPAPKQPGCRCLASWWGLLAQLCRHPGSKRCRIPSKLRSPRGAPVQCTRHRRCHHGNPTGAHDKMELGLGGASLSVGPQNAHDAFS